MKKLTALFLITFMLLASGCETARGLGRDIKKGGQWIQQKVSGN